MTSPSRRLRVVHVVPDLSVAGLQRVVETLCRSTDPRRFEVGVLTLNHLGELAESLRRDGFAVQQLPRTGTGPDYWAWRRVAAFLRRERIDVVHTHNTQAFMHGGVGALLAGVPTLIHTDHARAFPDKLKYAVFENMLSAIAYRVVGVSEHTTESLRRYEWIPRRKLRTIPNGIDERLFDTPVRRDVVRTTIGIPTDAEVLLLGARLEEQKGVSYLVQAVARLAPSRPRLHLLLAGDGTLRDALVAECIRLGVASRVHFLGVRLDMPALLQAADIFVLPSVWEGLPMIVLEALAARCPIIATRVGGVPSAVVDGTTGVLIPPRDVSALTTAIERLLEDSALRSRLAAAGRVLFDSTFSASAMSRRYESHYLREGA